MADYFKNDIPEGRPQIDPQFFNNYKNNNCDNKNSIVAVNTNFALKNLYDISIFKDRK